jgi:hypothetical protein
VPAYSGLVTQITGYRLVNSIADLQAVSNDMTANYALGKDIDGGNAALTTLGTTGFATTAPLTGQFDGMWHTISNISPSLTALFGDIGQGGVVRDLNIDTQTGTVDTPFYSGVGILAINNHGTVINTFTAGTNSCGLCTSEVLAGLVGANYGLIERSGSSATVSTGVEAAGLVDTNAGTIDQSYATGSVTGYLSHGVAAGLVVSNQGSVSQSFASGSVSAGSPSNAGGICVGGCAHLAPDVYWDVQATGQASSGGNLPASNGLTTAQMSNPASFAGWDFGPNGAWVMPAGATHPVLRWQVAH